MEGAANGVCIVAKRVFALTGALMAAFWGNIVAPSSAGGCSQTDASPELPRRINGYVLYERKAKQERRVALRAPLAGEAVQPSPVRFARLSQ